ncbi:helix-turn-helix domain-containing protein [Melioribacteraceae bacterium 4301-Me]|uniref:helix-turn-helix domain-containing protein n=1 Tax=Pyranulibacter aquaticus TaxID=3163344 RepID=UPI0035955EC6
MLSELLDNFAKELKAIREEKKISLQQISIKTKIDPKFLEAIEEANFDILPQVYMRAFIKEYAEVLELNPNEVIAKYDKAMSGSISKFSTEENNEHEKTKGDIAIKDIFHGTDFLLKIKEKFAVNINLVKRALHTKKNLPYFLTGLVVILFFVIYFFSNHGSNKITEEKPYDQLLKEQANIESAANANIQNSSKSPLDSLSLFIKTKDSVWIKITADTTTREYLLPPNNSIKIKALRKYRLVVGNAGGVDIQLNGEQLQSLGKPGEVKTVTIDRQGLKFLPNNL